MLVGFHVEGHDHLILRALIATRLGLAEASIEVDQIDLPSRGWQQVLEHVPRALHRFYGKGAALAVVGVDNDGDDDLLASGAKEASAHPRHWNHASASNASCRYCRLQQVVAGERPKLTWRTAVQPWPVVVAVPVEAIEAWLWALRAIVSPGSGSLHAERQRRGPLKQALYGRPAATLDDVQRVAVPLVQQAAPAQLDELERASASFRLFADDLRAARAQFVQS